MDKHRYLIIKFEELPHTEMDIIQCVPNQWIGDFYDNNRIKTHFPPIIEYPAVDEMAKNSKDPNPNWKMYPAILLEGTSSYKDAEKLLQVLRRSHSHEPIRFESTTETTKRPIQAEVDQVKRQKVTHVPSQPIVNKSTPVINEIPVLPKPSTSTGLLNESNSSQFKTIDTGNSAKFRHFLEDFIHIDENDERPPSRAISATSGDDNVDNNVDVVISDQLKSMFDEFEKKLREKMIDELDVMFKDLRESIVFFCRQLRSNSDMAPQCEIIEDENSRGRASSNPFDSKHSLLHRNPGQNLMELLPNRGVYILQAKLNHSLRMSKDNTELARNLFEGIFDINTAPYLNFSQLDTNAKNTLLDYIEKHCKDKGETFDKQKVLSCMKNVLGKWRYKTKNV